MYRRVFGDAIRVEALERQRGGMHATTSQSREENNVVPGERSGRPLGSYGVLMACSLQNVGMLLTAAVSLF